MLLLIDDIVVKGKKKVRFSQPGRPRPGATSTPRLQSPAKSFIRSKIRQPLAYFCQEKRGYFFFTITHNTKSSIKNTLFFFPPVIAFLDFGEEKKRNHLYSRLRSFIINH